MNHVPRVCSRLVYQRLLKMPQWTIIYADHKRITTTAPLMLQEIRSEGERSWVKKIFRGSGPAAETEEGEAEMVEVEPQYLDVLTKKRESFIEKPETRKRVYTPPEDLEDVIFEITKKVCPEVEGESWKSKSLQNVSTKYEILMKCSNQLDHDVPSFMLGKVSTVEDVINFYEQPVKDTTKFDELSTQDLPKNLKIHWEYEDDSQLEIYQEYLDYTRVKKTGPPSKWPFREELY